ncbi:hypothetical protein HU200_034069 [Digitaria exilis]|uniref:PGG domain-containing protein n=1 Tax=Digitaria exilis TaxID=1010633 RepID=A0A835EP23_9POAL|nr:hypothetical protein HU200_034069 [Digitaria exilis]
MPRRRRIRRSGSSLGVAPSRRGEGDSLLHVVAAHAGDDYHFVDCAKTIYHGNAGLLAARNNKGDTPLHCAAGAGSAGMVSCLVGLKAAEAAAGDVQEFVRTLNGCGETALHRAVRAGSVACIDELLLVDPMLAASVPDEGDDDHSGGASPFYLAISLGRMDIARYLFDKSNGHLSYSGLDGQNALHAAVSRGQGYALTPYDLSWVKIPSSFYYDSMLGVVSVLVATVTFASAFTLPGGYYQNGTDSSNGVAGAPLLAGSYAFDAFILSDTLAFICSCMATFSLVFAGVPAMDIPVRCRYFEISALLLRSSGRSLVVAFALGLYLVLAPVAHTTAAAICVIIFVSSLYGNSEAWQIIRVADTARARLGTRMRVAWTLGLTFYNVFVNVFMNFWSFVIIFGVPAAFRKLVHHER